MVKVICCGVNKMKNEEVDLNALDLVFDNMLQTMTQSKGDIYAISEQSREYYEQLKLELEEIQQEISLLIKNTDALEIKSKKSRHYLATVSKDFTRYSEKEVRRAYEDASELQVALSMNTMTEKQLRQRRDLLERRLVALLDTINRADQLVNQVTVVLNYLTSDLKVVGEALEDAKNKQDFAIGIIEAQEEERKRLSRDIHDGTAQMLANILLRTGLIEKVYKERGEVAAQKEWKYLRESVRSTLIEVRRVIFDLRPMDLDDLGIVPALQKYLGTISEYEKGVSIDFTSLGKEKRLHSNFEVAIFRVVQESVTNAMKHGQPNHIWVKVEWLQDMLNVVVKDDGIGFDLDEAKEKSFGIISMRERIDLLKGDMKINTSKGQGTTILFQIPLP